MWLALAAGDCQWYGTLRTTMSDPEFPSRTWWQRFRGWPGAGRWATYVALTLVLVLVAVLVAGVVLVRRPFPQVDGTIEVPGLGAAVEVVRDDHGIPQLYGDSMADLMAAQGYVHAQERFYEMDVRRHITAGRLSELFGSDSLETDEFIRTLGWRRVAEQELPLLKPETRAALEAYAAGVNAYLETHSPSEMAVEYTVLGLGGLDYRPEPWTPVDSLAWLKAMAWDLKGNVDEEIERALDGEDHTADQVAELFPAYDYRAHQPIVQQGAVVDGVFEQDATTGGTRTPERPAYTAAQRGQLADLRRLLDSVPALVGKGDGIGSNSWVVDGAHSTTGEPLLANDPHLGVGIPGIWVQMGLHCTTVGDDCPLDVAGFTFSGVPGVIIGHNADVAWGFTNLGPDVTDLYVERVTDDQWEQDGRLRPLTTRQETIKVLGGDDVTITVRATKHGPIVSDLVDLYADVAEDGPPDPSGTGRGAQPGTTSALSLAWTALTPTTTADAILEIDTAHDWASFREAASSFAVPAQNLVYADREGHIGYQAPGLVPIRKSGNDGLVPQAGWLSENDWTGDYVPFDGLPNVLDPDEGFIVTANQAVVGPDYPYFLTSDWDRGYRSERIRDLIEQQGRLSVDDMAALQLDTRSPLAPDLVPRLLAVDLPRGYASAGQRLLRHWDFDQDADSAAAEYFNVVWRNILEMTFHDDLPEDAWPFGGDRWIQVVGNLLEQPDSTWWDDADTPDVVEHRDDILREAMVEARDEVTRLDAVSVEGWEWGHLHHLDLRNQTLGESGIGPVEWLVNRGGWEVGGSAASVNASGWDATDPYSVDFGPSMRMVVSLADFDDSRWVNLTGVSGHPFNAHYTDQTDLWAEGRTLPWLFSRDAVEEAGEHTLTLMP
jgi:penicillin amidase